MRVLELLIWVGILALIMTGFGGCAAVQTRSSPPWTKEDIAHAVVP